MGDPSFTELRGEKIHLRRMLPQDASNFQRYRCHPEVARYQSWDTDFSMEDASKFVSEQVDRVPAVPGEWIQLAIALNDTDELVGDCAFCCDEYEPRIVEMGVTMSPDHQRQGIATEAIQLLMHYLLVTLGKHRIAATIDARNEASIALFKRLKFRNEAHYVENVFFKGEWGDEVLFAILAKDFRSTAGSTASSACM